MNKREIEREKDRSRCTADYFIYFAGFMKLNK